MVHGAADPETQSDSLKYETLVMSGGGAKCMATLGAAQYMYDTGMHEKITTYIGTSAGTMVGLMLAIGYTPIDLITYVCCKKIIESIMPIDPVSLITGNGGMQFAKIVDVMEEMMEAKIGTKKLSLQQLYDVYGKTLVCTTYNTRTYECLYVSKDTHPDLECVKAVHMSSALPLLFDDCVHDDDVYIDGAAVDNFPITISNYKNVSVLGIFVYNESHKSRTNKIVDMINIVSNNAVHYINKICDLIEHDADIVRIKLTNASTLSCGPSHVDETVSKLDLFSHGYNVARAYYDAKKSARSVSSETGTA